MIIDILIVNQVHAVLKILYAAFDGVLHIDASDTL